MTSLYCGIVQEDSLVKCIWAISINVVQCAWMKGCCQLRTDLQLVHYVLRSRESIATFKETGAQEKAEVSWRSCRNVMHQWKCSL